MGQHTELMKGVLEGCVLEIISHGQTYGYAITQQLQAMGFTEIVEGTVYTVTARLEKRDLVDIERRESAIGPPRKFYRLNNRGREELQRFWASWDFISSACQALREPPKGECI